MDMSPPAKFRTIRALNQAGLNASCPARRCCKSWQASGLLITFRSGVAQRVLAYKSFSLWGMVNVGASFGPGTVPAGTSAANTPTDVKSAFAYGGFGDLTIRKNLGAVIFLQSEKDAAPNGFRFAPRLALRYKF